MSRYLADQPSAGKMPEMNGVAARSDWIAGVRARFASLGGDFVFLDAPGGTQTPDEVAAAVARVYREASGNTGAPYATSRRIGALVDDARAASARFLGCTPEEIIFGASMTTLNYMLTRTVGRELRSGDEIVVTRLDHDANVAPWLDLARDRGLQVRLADVHSDTTLDLGDLERQLSPKTRVVAFPWASNAVGTIVDARAVCGLAHQSGALAWVDAVQYAPHEPIDVRAIDADILFCSAYKFCGPHLGIAFGRRELLESWQPYKARPARLSRPDGASRPGPCRMSCWADCSPPSPTWRAWATPPTSSRRNGSLVTGCSRGYRAAPGCTACRRWLTGYLRSCSTFLGFQAKR